ncbi:MAG: HD domain-containing protein [Lachnospiraceae bacterium]
MNIVDQVMKEMITLYCGDPKRIQHFTKVFSYASFIGKSEKIKEEELEILEIAALMHDIGIHYCEKMYGSCKGKLQEQEGPWIARELLERLDVKKAIIERVCFLIGCHHTYQDVNAIDWRIILEADFLVNAYEDHFPKESILAAYENIFKTQTGRWLCEEMFGLQNEK